MWLFNLLFSSLSQLWYVEVRISRSVSVSPLEFEITRVDCIILPIHLKLVHCAIWKKKMSLFSLKVDTVWSKFLIFTPRNSHYTLRIVLTKNRAKLRGYAGWSCFLCSNVPSLWLCCVKVDRVINQIQWTIIIFYTQFNDPLKQTIKMRVTFQK